jgi:hypothetical protein
VRLVDHGNVEYALADALTVRQPVGEQEIGRGKDEAGDA